VEHRLQLGKQAAASLLEGDLFPVRIKETEFGLERRKTRLGAERERETTDLAGPEAVGVG
jgi:hypothetical protein